MPQARSWRWVRRALPVAGAAAVLLAAWLAWDREALSVWRREAGPLPFFAAMALVPAIGVPITPFFVMAGAMFGTQLGLLGSWLALGLNLAGCYGIARRMRPRLESLMRRFDYELPHFGERENGAVRFTLAVKLMPGVPAFVKNYALGMAGVPFAVYFGWSMLITGLYATALVLIGESLIEHRSDRAILAAAVVVALAIAIRWWRRSR
jgi:uncharacterized membrane protein YdjX (TVP38/TMEM64 family)